MITVTDLIKTYGGRVETKALRGVSFDVADGEFVDIMGRSGSGKSTLLHQLGLLDRPTSGRLTLGNTDALALPERARARFRLQQLGYVFQEYALLSEFTALENVALPAVANGLSGHAARRRAHELLDLVGLGARAGHRPSELSGGEQQRVAIARALVNRPVILLADEPTANLDTESARTVLDLFARLNRERGQTVVMVTHEIEDAVYANRIIWLKDGLIERIETRRV